MSYVIVGNRYQHLNLYEKQVLFLDFVVAAETTCADEADRDFHRWLTTRVVEGRNLGEIAYDLGQAQPEWKAAEAWAKVDDYVGRLIERGVARALRIVVVS